MVTPANLHPTAQGQLPPDFPQSPKYQPGPRGTQSGLKRSRTLSQWSLLTAFVRTLHWDHSFLSFLGVGFKGSDHLVGIGPAGFCDASGQQCSWTQELTLGPEFESENQVIVKRGQGVVLYTCDQRQMAHWV